VTHCRPAREEKGKERQSYERLGVGCPVQFTGRSFKGDHCLGTELQTLPRQVMVQQLGMRMLALAGEQASKVVSSTAPAQQKTGTCLLGN